uniref:Uncharacterized protein n=1 Tax=Lepeophtheirus salmonis TaxID=72036 RepID=A0A0K2ULP8_LEPSM
MRISCIVCNTYGKTCIFLWCTRKWITLLCQKIFATPLIGVESIIECSKMWITKYCTNPIQGFTFPFTALTLTSFLSDTFMSWRTDCIAGLRLTFNLSLRARTTYALRPFPSLSICISLLV